jgi:ribonuclease HI
LRIKPVPTPNLFRQAPARLAHITLGRKRHDTGSLLTLVAVKVSATGTKRCAPSTARRRQGKQRAQDQVWVVSCDGTFSPDTGQAGIGVVICDGAGVVTAEWRRSCSADSSLEAEYLACIAGTQLARRMLRGRSWVIQTDSKTVVKQVQGKTPTRPPAVVAACNQLRQALGSPSQIRWIPRARNCHADRLAAAAAAARMAPTGTSTGLMPLGG